MAATTAPEPRAAPLRAARPERLTICLATDSTEPSGMGRMMLTLGRGLARRHRVILAAVAMGDGSLLEAAAAAGLETWRLGEGDASAGHPAFRAALARVAADVVNVHGGIGWEGHALVRAARATGAAVVRTEHLPFLVTTPEQRRDYDEALGSVDRVLAVSNGVARTLLAAQVPPERLRVVRNGIDDPRPMAPADAVRDGLGVPAGAPLIVTVARAAPQKGYDVLLPALRAVIDRRPDVRALLVGSGPLAASVVEDVGRLGLGCHVQWREASHDVAGLLAASDVVALASRFEGLPLVALEAMALGRPVVGTRVCGIDEAVEDRVTGFLAPPDDPAALASALLEALDVTAGDAEAMAEAARRRYETLFTARRMVQDTEVAFMELLSSRRSARRGLPSPMVHAGVGHVDEPAAHATRAGHPGAAPRPAAPPHAPALLREPASSLRASAGRGR